MLNTHGWAWTQASELAAHLVAEGRLSIPKIAAQCHVSEKTIDRWKKIPDFKTRVDEHLAAMRLRFRTEGFSVPENRIAAKRRRLCAIMGALRKRAGRPDRGGAEWDRSGYFVQRLRSINAGDGQFYVVTEYELDTGALAALNDLEREIAIETGTYKTKIEHSGKIDAPSPKVIVMAQVMTTTEILAIIERAKNVDTPEPVPAAVQPEGTAPGPETEGGE